MLITERPDENTNHGEAHMSNSPEKTRGEQIEEALLQNAAMTVMHQLNDLGDKVARSRPDRDAEGGLRKVIKTPDGDIIGVYMKKLHGQLYTFHISRFASDAAAKRWLLGISNLEVIIKLTDLYARA